MLGKLRVFALEAAILIVAVVAISAYQSRNLLDADGQMAPSLVGEQIDGDPYVLQSTSNDKTLVYFFAPWCRFCAASADNIVRLRKWREPQSLNIVMVAIGYESPQEVIDYADRHALSVPIVLGDSKVASDWNIYAFPTYYVLDGDHSVVARDIGYSSTLGLLVRTW
jgi:peroxiredoxin